MTSPLVPDAGRCTVFVDGGWRGELSPPPGARPGPVAVLGRGGALLSRVVTGVAAAGLGSSVIAETRGATGLERALRAVAEHGDIAAALLVDLPAEAFADASDAITAAARALPMVCVDATGELSAHPIAARWLAARGVGIALDDAVAVASLPVLVGLEPLAGSRIAVAAADARGAAWLAREAARFGFEPVASVVDPRSSAAHELAASTAQDATVVHLGAPTTADGVPPAVVLLDAPAPPALRPAFVQAGALVVDEPPFRAMRWLQDWAGARDAAARPGRTGDTSDIRRAAQASLVDSSPLDERSAGWLRALRIPRLERRVAPYVEDALVEARSLGYPIRVAARLDAPPTSLPAATVCNHLDALEAACDALLADVRARHGRVAQLELMRPLTQGVDLVLRGWRDQDFGPVVALQLGDSELVDVRAPSRRAIAALVTQVGLAKHDLVLDALTGAAGNVLLALNAEPRLDGLETVLHVAPTGYGAGDIHARVHA